MQAQHRKARQFQQLHQANEAFVLGNPWDAGTARLLSDMGYKALGTTSAGYAYTLGRRDNTVDRDEMLVNIRAIVEATDLPVSGDLENGYGDAPEAVAETIRLGAEAGLVGASIEDAVPGRDSPVYDIGLATERVAAAVEAARALPYPFTLTARAENFMVGLPDLDDTIRRLQAYQEAGADVLYAPALKERAQIEAIVGSVERPVNVLMGLKGVSLDLAELNAMGVRRVSIGSGFARAAYGAFLEAAREVREHGTFTFADRAIGYHDIAALLDRR